MKFHQNIACVQINLVANACKENLFVKDKYQMRIKKKLILITFGNNLILPLIEILLLILMNKPQQAQTSNMLAGLTGMDSNEDSLLDADNSNSFDLKNENYQLKSRCNAIEYEKNKLVINYENTIKDLKQKYANLERQYQDSKGSKGDENVDKIINDLRGKCQALSQQNDSLKRDMQSAYQKNRSTPNFNSFAFMQEMDALGGLLQKQQIINKLEIELKQAKEGQYHELRQKITTLQRQNNRMKEEQRQLDNYKQEVKRMMNKQAQDHYSNILRSKDKSIESLKNQQTSLTLQLESAKKGRISSNTQIQGGQQGTQRLYSQLQEKQTQLANLQKQNAKLKVEKTKVDQENRYFDSQRRQENQKKIVLQEEIRRLKDQLSEMRDVSVNEKLQNKKIFNSLRSEMEEEINRSRILIQEKIQQNKRLQNSILSLNDQIESLKKKDMSSVQKIQFLMKQNGALQDNLRELKVNLLNFEDVHRKLQLNSTKEREYQLNMKMLEEEMRKLRAEHKDKNSISQQELRKYKQIEDDMKYKNDVVELMKIEKEQYLAKQKQFLQRIRQKQEKQAQKQKIIENLQQEIKHLKDDNRYLQLGNEELKEKMDTMQNVVTDVDAINRQLKKEKTILEEKRREQEREVIKKGEELEKMKETEAELLQIIEEEGSPQARRFSLNSRRSVGGVNGKQVKNALHRLSSRRNSIGYTENLVKQVEDLTGQNYKLQMQLSEVQNELERKSMDLNTRTQQIAKLKQVASSPKEIDFAPLIEISKKNQFNAVFFENRIMELQKEINGIRTVKQQELQQFKKICRKQMEEKYLGEIKRLNSYCYELQKNINILNSRLGQQNHDKNQAMDKLQSLQKSYYSREYQYSETLTEYNQLLQKYKSLEEDYTQVSQQHNSGKKQSDQISYLKSALDKLTKKYQESSSMLTNSYDQIRKLNQLLMAKQNQIKHFNSSRRTTKSPNEPLTSQQFSEQRMDHKLYYNMSPNFQKMPSPHPNANYTRI